MGGTDVIAAGVGCQVLCCCVVSISALTLFESNVMLGDLLLSQPLNTLSLFDSAIQSVAQSLLQADDHANEQMVKIISIFVYRHAFICPMH